MYRGQTLQVRCDESKLKLPNTEIFQLGQGQQPTTPLRQSDFVDYRAAYFAAKISHKYSLDPQTRTRILKKTTL